MTTAQLERAALMPYLFVQKLASDDALCIKERIVLRAAGTRFWDWMTVLPGGRYILSTLDQTINVYDMGQYMSSGASRKPTVKASRDLGRRILRLDVAPYNYNVFKLCAATETADRRWASGTPHFIQH